MRRAALFSVMMVMSVAMAGCNKQEAKAPQANAAEAVAPAAEPEPAVAVVTDNKGKSAPDAKFIDLADGSTKTLADFKGKPVLVNLWATWCVPCVKELPTLAKLAQDQDGKLTVLALSQDMQGAKVVEPFLKAKGIAIHPYHDADNAIMLALKEASLPATVLYDAQGKEVWRISGDLDWTSAKAKELLAQAGA